MIKSTVHTLESNLLRNLGNEHQIDSEGYKNPTPSGSVLPDEAGGRRFLIFDTVGL